MVQRLNMLLKNPLAPDIKENPSVDEGGYHCEALCSEFYGAQ